MSPLSVIEFENRLRREMSWVLIHRDRIAEIAEDLRRGADHIDQVGWTRHHNFDNPADLDNSPCCAVGSLHFLNTVSFPRSCYVGDVVWVFEALYGMNLVSFNDYEAVTAQDVTGAMRTVASHIEAYLEATGE